MIFCIVGRYATWPCTSCMCWPCPPPATTLFSTDSWTQLSKRRLENFARMPGKPRYKIPRSRSQARPVDEDYGDQTGMPKHVTATTASKFVWILCNKDIFNKVPPYWVWPMMPGAGGVGVLDGGLVCFVHCGWSLVPTPAVPGYLCAACVPLHHSLSSSSRIHSLSGCCGDPDTRHTSASARVLQLWQKLIHYLEKASTSLSTWKIIIN